VPLRRYASLVVPLGVVGIILLLVVPLPAFMLDLLLAVNISVSLLVLLVAMQVKRPLDFSVFPSIVLVATLFRLGLNVASTRLVLTDGYAGKVIEAFGHIVIGSSLVIGLVVFLILVVIQFAVITNGAGRVAEVGARFTLDAMPGKQMAIDADLNSGAIDEDEARRRRRDVSAEADFYGAMDGASKFVKGDAIAAVVIVVVNLLGGFAMGMISRGMSASEALSTYSLLTVGDGLVSQIPALLVSTASGLIVTRASTDDDMGTDAARQLLAQKPALIIGGAATLLLGLVPGLPKLPFLLVAALLLAAGLRRPAGEGRRRDAGPSAAELAAAAPARPSDTPEAIVADMRVDPLEVALAPDLVDLVDTGSGGDLLERVRGLRRKVAMELGLVMPPVRTRDDVDLPPSTYAIRLSGVEVARGQAPAGQVLAIGDGLEHLPGRPAVDPVFGLAGRWVPVELRLQAEVAGATVVDRASVLITHLGEVVHANAPRLLGREDVRMLVEQVKKTHPVVAEELTPAALTLGEVQGALQGLLAERVPVRDLTRIFEALASRARAGTDTDGLVEAARAALGPAVAAPHAPDGTLAVLTLDPVLEHGLLERLRTGDGGAALALPAHEVEALCEDAAATLARAEQTGRSPVLVCSPALRPALRRLLAGALPRLVVLSYGEVSGPLRIETMGVITGAHAAAARGF
jgi:flagellar biosynthesis protein FlhA